MRAEGRAPTTLTALRDRLARFAEVLGLIDAATLDDLAQLLPWHIQSVKTTLAEPPYNYSTNYLHNTLATVHGFLAWCVHPQGALEVNPAKGLVPTRGKPKRRALTPKQREELLLYSKPDRARIYELLMLTGLRRGELRARVLGGEPISGSDLTTQSVVRGVRGWFLRVTNKAKTREVPLEGRALAIVQELVAEAEAAGRTELVPVSYATFNGWWSLDMTRLQKALAKAGDTDAAKAWDGLTFHSLRATAITVMVNDLRLPLGDVAAVVGHDDIRTTESYREPDEEMVRHRLSGLAAVMFSPEGRCFPSVSGTVAVRATPSDR